ncbi:MAG: aldolase [Gammaproteobacteria bacterium]|nr:aldolase [Gammaproteobacteria bacterium]
MTNTSTRLGTFRRRLAARERIVGTFQKTPHATVTELLGMAGLDCVCIDAEHAPFDRAAIDVCVLSARGADLPSLVRVPSPEASHILNALDLGATGVLVPHVASADAAREIVRASRYGKNGRGYSGSTRAAGYSTRTMPQVVATANESVAVILQIEDEPAVERIEEIAAVDGVDALFVGRMDLTVSIGASSPDDPRVLDAVRRICTAAQRHGRCVGMFTPTTAEALRWRADGVSFFLLGSDQQWVLNGARDLANSFNGA